MGDVSIPQRCDLNWGGAKNRSSTRVSIPQRCDLNFNATVIAAAPESFNPATVRFE